LHRLDHALSLAGAIIYLEREAWRAVMFHRDISWQTGSNIGASIGAFGVWFALGMPSLSVSVIALMGVAAAAGSLSLGYVVYKLVRG
jgi:hypothetical protein